MDPPLGLPLPEVAPSPDSKSGSPTAGRSAPAGDTTDERSRYATTAVAFGMLVLGAFWRLFDLGYPRSFAFDEHHFVRNARNYMIGQPDWNDHPPLGKLLLIPAMRLLGDNGVGWRLASALLGVLLIGLAGLIAARIFESARVGLLTAAFVAIDGFFISYARVALLDTPMTVFVYGALALMLWAHSLWWFVAAAICVGLAVATKWTGVCIMLIAPWLLMRGEGEGKGIGKGNGKGWAPWHAIWMFGLASLVYVGVVAMALRITGQPFSLSGLLVSNVSLLKHHAGFTVWDNAASSRWFTWPFLTHPILMHYESVGPSTLRATTSLGNILLWFSTTAAMAWTLFAGARVAWRRRGSDRPIQLQTNRKNRSWALGGSFALVTMLALVLPFVVTRRQSYIFHYLGAYGLGLGLLASWLVKLEGRFSRPVLAFLGLAAAVSIFYAPVWTNALISRTGFLIRLPFPAWH
jgi:dolichyl-phosphate-mannose-protein mannosyltransferase